MLFSSIDALRIGNSRNPVITACTTNGMYVSFTPRSAYASLCARRSLSIAVKSTSKTVVTCAEVCFEITMCCAIFLRMTESGSRRVDSPALNCIAGAAFAAGAGAGAGSGVSVRGCCRYSRMSFFVTRPEMPEPLICAMSTSFSFAILRTSGDDFVRRRSSRSSMGAEGCWVARLLGCSGGAGAGAGCGAGAEVGAGAGSGFGAGAADAGADAAASPSAEILAITELTETVCPSWARISVSVPAAGAGISASTLSVEISSSGSSRSTLSPGFFSHLTTVPSAIDSPICGMTTSVAMNSSSFFRVGFLMQSSDLGKPCSSHRHAHDSIAARSSDRCVCNDFAANRYGQSLPHRTRAGQRRGDAEVPRTRCAHVVGPARRRRIAPRHERTVAPLGRLLPRPLGAVRLESRRQRRHRDGPRDERLLSPDQMDPAAVPQHVVARRPGTDHPDPPRAARQIDEPLRRSEGVGEGASPRGAGLPDAERGDRSDRRPAGTMEDIIRGVAAIYCGTVMRASLSPGPIANLRALDSPAPSARSS